MLLTDSILELWRTFPNELVYASIEDSDQLDAQAQYQSLQSTMDSLLIAKSPTFLQAENLRLWLDCGFESCHLVHYAGLRLNLYSHKFMINEMISNRNN